MGGSACPFLILHIRRGPYLLGDTLLQINGAKNNGSLKKPLKVTGACCHIKMWLGPPDRLNLNGMASLSHTWFLLCLTAIVGILFFLQVAYRYCQYSVSLCLTAWPKTHNDGPYQRGDLCKFPRCWCVCLTLRAHPDRTPGN